MSLGIVIVDTLPDKRCARDAVERTLRNLRVDDCLVVSDECFVAGARHVPVAPLAGLSGYNALLLDRLAGHLLCDTYLVVQWDGFVIDGKRWQPSFQGCDYIGAPWWHRGGAVGCGGFSLRSRRLVAAVQALRRLEAEQDVATAEDLQVCVRHRGALEAAGFRFASTDLAAAFAFERIPDGGNVPPAFGFHGAFNFPHVLGEEETLLRLDAIVSRMPGNWRVWTLFVGNAWRCGQQTLATRLLAALALRDPRIWAQVVRACLARGVPAGWLKAAA